MMDPSTGEVWNQKDIEEYYASHVTEEIRAFEDRMVNVSGYPEAIAELSANVATSHENLLKLHEEARLKALRKLR